MLMAFDERYTQVMLEDITNKFDIVLELLIPLAQDVAVLKRDMAVVKEDLKLDRAMLKAHNIDLEEHDRRILALEAA